MGDALFQTPYAQAAPCRLPERRLLPTLHKYFLFFNFTFSLAGVVSRAPVVPGPPRIFYFSPSVPHYGGCALPDALCAGRSLPSSRASAPADFAQIFFVFQFYILSRGSCLQSTGGARASAHFLFLPLCPPLWGMRSHRRPMRRPLPAVFPSVGSCRLCIALIIICFSFLHSLSRELSPDHRRCQGLRAFFIPPPSVPHYGGCALPDALCANPSRTCLLCWRPRGLHRATSDNCR